MLQPNGVDNTTERFLQVVVDTNILISAGLKPGGLEARVVELALTGDLAPMATEWTWAEYERVLRRPKFAGMAEWVEATLRALDERLNWCVAHERILVATDEADNRFLECAVAGGCSYLITGNCRHFPAKHLGVRVRNARQFLVETGRLVELG